MTMLARTARVVVPAAAFLLLLGGCGHPAGPARGVSGTVTMVVCGSRPQPAPSVVEVVCGTSELTADRLNWSDWGRPVATAVGTAVVDLCTYEDCHTGSFAAVPIVMIASGLTRCQGSTRVYSRLQYVFVGRSPFAGLPANVSTANDMADPGRALPPRDQTVSLTC
jgi:hypothetical protein